MICSSQLGQFSGAIDNVWRQFWCRYLLQLEECYRHLVCTSQGSCSPTYHAQDSSQQRIIMPPVSAGLRLRHLHYDCSVILDHSQYHKAPPLQGKQAARPEKPLHPLRGGNSWPLKPIYIIKPWWFPLFSAKESSESFNYKSPFCFQFLFFFFYYGLPRNRIAFRIWMENTGSNALSVPTQGELAFGSKFLWEAKPHISNFCFSEQVYLTLETQSPLVW